MGKAQKYRGVRQRHWGSWVSEIRHPITKTRVWLGTFQSGEEAALAYDEAARFMCGAHAKTNYPYTYNNSRGYVLSPTLREKLRRCCYTMDHNYTTTTTKPQVIPTPQNLMISPSNMTTQMGRDVNPIKYRPNYELPIIGSHYVSFSSWNNDDLWKVGSSISSSTSEEELEEDVTTTTTATTTTTTRTTSSTTNTSTSTTSSAIVAPTQQPLPTYEESKLFNILPPVTCSTTDAYNHLQFSDDFNVEEMIQELLNCNSFDLDFNLSDLPNLPSNLDYLAI